MEVHERGKRDWFHSLPTHSQAAPLRNRGPNEPDPGNRVEGSPGLAVDAVRLGLPRRADDPHETVSELLQDQPLSQGLRLPAQLSLPGLVQETFARRLHHLLCDKRVRQPKRDKKKSNKSLCILIETKNCLACFFNQSGPPFCDWLREFILSVNHTCTASS